MQVAELGRKHGVSEQSIYRRATLPLTAGLRYPCGIRNASSLI